MIRPACVRPYAIHFFQKMMMGISCCKACHWLRVLGQLPLVVVCGLVAMVEPLVAPLLETSPVATSRLRGKRVLVTGATSGVGRCAALRFAGLGAEVVLACRSREKGEELKREIEGRHATAKVYIADLDLASLESARRCALNMGRNLDVVVLNAGINTNTPTERHADLKCSSIFGVNFVAQWYFLNMLRPFLNENCRVVCLSSVMHHMADPALFLPDETLLGHLRADYSESKLAMNLLARSLRRQDDVFDDKDQKKLEGVAVNPGFVQSDIWRYTNPFVKPVFDFLMSFLALCPDQVAATTVFAAATPQVGLDDYFAPYLHPLPFGLPFCSAFEFLGPFAGPRRAYCRLPRHEKQVASSLWQTCASLCADFLPEHNSPSSPRQSS